MRSLMNLHNLMRQGLFVSICNVLMDQVKKPTRVKRAGKITCLVETFLFNCMKQL